MDHIATTLLAVLVAASGGPAPDEAGYRTVITPQRSRSNDFDVDRSVHVITADDLAEGQPLDGPGAVDGLPGVHTQRSNRGAGSPLLRGLVGPQNLLLVDGLRFNASTFRTGPNQYAALVDPLALSGIEVLLGPGSVLYGFDAVGGTIHYMTVEAPAEAGGFGRARLGFDSADLGSEVSVLGGGRYGPVAGWAGGGLRVRRLLRTGGGEVVPHSDLVQGDWRLKVRAGLGAGWSLTAAYLGMNLPAAERIDGVGVGDVRAYRNHDDFAYVSLDLDGGADLLRGARVAVSYHRVDEQVRRSICLVDRTGGVLDRQACLERADWNVTQRRVYEDETHVVGLLGTVEVHPIPDRLRLTGGLEGRVELVESARRDATAGTDWELVPRARGNFSDGSLYGGLDLFAFAEGRPYVAEGIVDVAANVGGRVSLVGAFAPDVPGVGDASYQHVGGAVTAGLRAILAQRVNLYANYAQGFRAPNLQETTVLGDTGDFFETPNPDLRPERSDTVELGLKLHAPLLRLRGAWFHTELSDMIVRADATWEGQRQVAGRLVKRRVNARRGLYDGAEISLELGPLAGLTAFGDFAWIKGSVIGGGRLRPARRVPPMRGTGGLRWAGSAGAGVHVYASLYVRWAADQARLSGDDQQDLRICADPTREGHTLGDRCPGTPGWWTLNLRGGVRPVEGLRVDLALLNALDASYRHHGSGYDEPGVHGLLSVRYDL